MPRALSRVSVLDDVGDQWAEEGSLPWAKWFIGVAQLRTHALERDVSGLQEVIGDLEKHAAWKVLGYASFELMCSKEIGLAATDITAIRSAKPGTKTGRVLGSHGGDHGNQHTGGKRQASDRSLPYGETTAYLLSRLKRDHSEPGGILERPEAGEFRSVRKAAIEAGIVKVPTPLDKLRRAWSEATGTERTQFLQWTKK